MLEKEAREGERGAAIDVGNGDGNAVHEVGILDTLIRQGEKHHLSRLRVS